MYAGKEGEIDMFDRDKVEEAIKLLLEGVGEDVEREGLKETPQRVARMYEEILSGMNQSPKEHLTRTFSCDNDNMVIEKDISFFSSCEHHMMPFFGVAHIAYIPNGKVVGISKLARTVETFAKRLQIQEQMTNQIADAIMEYMNPKGVMVMIEAEHMCMTMRGVKKPGTKTVTFGIKGVFEEDKDLRDRFFMAVK